LKGNLSHILTVLIVFIIATFANAQNCSFRGTITLRDGFVASNSMIHLLSDPENNMIRFITSDSLGYFNLNILHEGSYNLRFFEFGYRDTTINVSCKLNSSIDIGEIELLPLSLTMNELSIIDKVMIFKKRGDTTYVNTKYLETGNELSATDIIRNIPGISSKHGKYIFQGKNIDRILLEGIDIDDGGQISFTNSIDYSLIKDVKIIENYVQNEYDDIDSSKLGLVLDVGLKKNKKVNLQSSIESEVGYKKIYNLASSLLRANNSNAFRIVMKGSNSSEVFQEFDINEILRINRSEIHKANSYSLVSQGKYRMHRKQFGEDFLSREGKVLKLVGNFKLLGNGRLKSINAIRNAKYNYSKSIEEIFLVNNSNSRTATLQDANAFGIKSVNDVEYDIGEFMKAKFEMPFSVSWNSIDDQNFRILDNENYQNSQTTNYESINFTPRINLRYSNSSGWNGYLISQYQVISTNNVFALNSADSLSFGSVYEDSRYNQMQTTDWLYKRYIQQIRVSKSYESFKVVVNSISEKNNDRVNLRSLQPVENDFYGSDKLNFSSLTTSMHLESEINKYTLTGGFNHSKSIVRRRSDRQLFNFISPYITISYLLKNKWNIYSNYRESIMQPNLHQVSELQFIGDSQQVYSGMLPINFYSRRKIIQLGVYKDFGITMNRTDFLMNVNISPHYNDFVLNFNDSSSYLLQELEMVEIVNDVQLYGVYGKYNKEFSINTDITAQYKEAVYSNNNTSKTIYSSIGTRGIYKFSTRLEGNIGGEYKLNRTDSNFDLYRFQQLLITTGVQFNWHSVTGKIENIYSKSNSRFAVLEYNDLNFSLISIVPKLKLEFILEGRDILNIKGNNRINSINTESYISTSNLRIQGGQISVGMKFFL